MSVVVTLKFNNGILLASDRQVTRHGKAVKDSCNKIFNVEGTKFAIGGVGRLKELQDFKRVSKNLFMGIKALDENSCISAISKLTIEYRTNLLIELGEVIESLDSEFILADAYNINYLCCDLSVISNLDYFAIGCGEELVMGHLNVALKDKDISKLNLEKAKKLAEDCIKISCKDDCYVDDNIDYIVLYKDPKDIIEDSNYELIDKCEFEVLGKNKSKSVCNKKCEFCQHRIRFIFNKKSKTIDAVCDNPNLKGVIL